MLCPSLRRALFLLDPAHHRRIRDRIPPPLALPPRLLPVLDPLHELRHRLLQVVLARARAVEALELHAVEAGVLLLFDPGAQGGQVGFLRGEAAVGCGGGGLGNGGTSGDVGGRGARGGGGGSGRGGDLRGGILRVDGGGGYGGVVGEEVAAVFFGVERETLHC